MEHGGGTGEKTRRSQGFKSQNERLELAAPRCAVCGRPLTNPARVVNGIGPVGPECYRKFAALEDFLWAHGAEGLLYGELVIGEWNDQETLAETNRVIWRLRKSGLRVTIERRETEHGRALAIRLAGVERPKTFRNTFRRDVWREWAEGIRRRAQARELEVRHA